MSYTNTREEIKPKLRKYEVSNKEFVKAWQQARSMPQLVVAFGMTDGKHARQKVMNRADKLRGQGVRLKKLQKGHVLTRIEVAELNNLIESVDKPQSSFISWAAGIRRLFQKR